VPKLNETSSLATAGAAIPSVAAVASMMESFLMAGLLFLSAQPLWTKTPAGRLRFRSNELSVMNIKAPAGASPAGVFVAFRPVTSSTPATS